MTAALRKSGACAALVSEEAPEPIEMYEGKGSTGLVVACDPVDGSSNLDVNGTVGTIFSLRPSRGWDPAGPAALGPGHGADRRGLRHVRARDHARLHGGQRHARLHDGPRHRASSS